jgi:DNA-binding GntR family transcriptional regulator
MKTAKKAAGVFSTLKQLSLSHGIAAQIHAALLSGQLKPGQQITEQYTCKALGVSRASFREALQQMRASGILTTIRRKTYINGPPDPQEIREVYVLRGICEGLAAAETKTNLQPDDFERLDVYLRRMEEASRNKDLEAFWQADLAFHDLIWHANQKPHLQRVMQSTVLPLHPFLIALLREATAKDLYQISQFHRGQFEDLRRFKGQILRKRIEKCYCQLGQFFIAVAERQKWENFV